jgi:hypothetical protein
MGELKEAAANLKEFSFRAKFKNLLVVDRNISMRGPPRGDI